VILLADLDTDSSLSRYSAEKTVFRRNDQPAYRPETARVKVKTQVPLEDPYGRSTKVSGSISCDFQYAGMYYHATSGLNLTKYRAYDPNTGRWISRDPSGESISLDLYLYCSNNPINYVDNDGLARSDAQRTHQFIKGGLEIVGGIGAVALLTVVVVSTAPVWVVVGASAILITTAAAGLIVGEANIASAFSPNTPAADEMADTVSDLPSTANELAGRAIAGKSGQDVGTFADTAVTATTGDAADQALDLASKINDATTPPSPQANNTSGGSGSAQNSGSSGSSNSGGSCIDTPPSPPPAPPSGGSHQIILTPS
jgi:RHS repeat-associated protein